MSARYTFNLSVRANPDWRQLGKCREIVNAPGFDPEQDPFFPPQGGTSHEARAICRQCLVMQQCRQSALDNKERYGIWGDTSETERRALRGNKGRNHKTSSAERPVYLPAAPLREALQALAVSSYPSRYAMAQDLAHKSGRSLSAISCFTYRSQARVGLPWAIHICAAAGFDLATIYPEQVAA